MATSELASTYAALILADTNVEITADKITTLITAAKIEVEPIWATLLAKVRSRAAHEDREQELMVQHDCRPSRERTSSTFSPTSEEEEPPLPVPLPLPPEPPPLLSPRRLRRRLRRRRSLTTTWASDSSINLSSGRLV
jgi:hypothetical protein